MTPAELILELTTGPLTAELETHIVSGNDVEILHILNRKDIHSPGKITSHDLKQYFSLIGLRLPIMESTTSSCREVTIALEDFPVFDLTISEVYSKFIATLDALVLDESIPDFTETHKATILYLAATTISRAEQLGVYLTNKDIIDALWTPEGTRRIL
jgi:hypothetical protein